MVKVKKYRLSDGNTNKQKGSGLEYIYPSVPLMTGLTSQSYPFSAKMGLGMPLPYTQVSKDGVKMGIPLVSGNGNVKVTIPPAVDPRDPSVFFSVPASSSTKKELKDDSKVTITRYEPEPKRSIVQYQPTLPTIPGPFNFPVGLVPGPQIVLNPETSKARLEITSPDSDDIITVSSEDRSIIKDIDDGIQKRNKLKRLRNEAILAVRKLEFMGTDKDEWKTVIEKSGEELEDDAAKSNLIKAQDAIKKYQEAKKEALKSDSPDEIDDSKLISLTELFDFNTQKNTILDNLKITTDNQKKVEVSKKSKPQYPLFMSASLAPGFGPTITIS